MAVLPRTAMTELSTNCPWTIDLSARLASRGNVQIEFAPTSGSGIALSFLRGGGLALERQCLIAGEAIAAIEAAMRRCR